MDCRADNEVSLTYIKARRELREKINGTVEARCVASESNCARRGCESDLHGASAVAFGGLPFRWTATGSGSMARPAARRTAGTDVSTMKAIEIKGGADRLKHLDQTALWARPPGERRAASSRPTASLPVAVARHGSGALSWPSTPRSRLARREGAGCAEPCRPGDEGAQQHGLRPVT